MQPAPAPATPELRAEQGAAARNGVGQNVDLNFYATEGSSLSP
jgi:hypothetical protein